jgi:hydroxymethylpyrimidine pyrophosphatase-like HAD family hydrolase
LLEQLQYYRLEVDGIVSFGGSVVADGKGNPLWLHPLEAKDVALIKQATEATCIEFAGNVLQMAAPTQTLPPLFGLRLETYQQIDFVAHWQASKFRAVHRLLRHLNWKGQVRAFGDGRYDRELLTYFDGVWITPFPQNSFQQEEVRCI